jgi:hypothetical protein
LRLSKVLIGTIIVGFSVKLSARLSARLRRGATPHKRRAEGERKLTEADE